MDFYLENILFKFDNEQFIAPQGIETVDVNLVHNIFDNNVAIQMWGDKKLLDIKDDIFTNLRGKVIWRIAIFLKVNKNMQVKIYLT